MINPGNDVFRKTTSLCPICCREIPSGFIRRDDKVWLEKECPVHGECSVLVSSFPDHFRELTEAYYELVPKDLPVRILEIAVTPRCAMNCPMCSVITSVGKAAREMSVPDIEKIIKNNPEKEFVLWGMEPTEHPEIERILKEFQRHNKTAHLFTNGQTISDINKLSLLKQAGLKHVYLQFDGFDEDIYRKLRGKPLLCEKLRVLGNLEQLEISTTLNVTLAKGINEEQIEKIIEYARQRKFIRQIGFLPLIRIGRADNFDKKHIPECHEFLSIIESRTNGRIKLDDLRVFQKLMYVVYRFTRFRRCFWFTFYVLIRDRKQNRYRSIGEILDLKKTETIIDGYRKGIKSKPGFWNDVCLIIKLAGVLMNKRTFPLLWSGMKFAFLGKKLSRARSGGELLFITCTDFCDFYKMDMEMSAAYCEEMLAIKTAENKIVYKPTYCVTIEESMK